MIAIAPQGLPSAKSLTIAQILSTPRLLAADATKSPGSVMDKTLDAMQLVHRLAMGLALAMVVLGCSIQQPTKIYKEAQGEIDQVHDALIKLSKFRANPSSNLCEDSELKHSRLA